MDTQTDPFLNFASMSKESIIDELRKTKEQLNDSLKKNEKLNIAFESSPVGMAIFNTDNSIYKLNKKFTELFGYTIDDIKTIEDWGLLAYPDESYRIETFQKWDSSIKEYLKTEKNFKTIIAKVTCKDKSIKDIEFSFEADDDTYLSTFIDLSITKNTEQEPIRSSATVQDVVKRKVVKEADIAENRKVQELIVFKKFADTSIEGFGMADLKTQILYMNKGLNDLYGFEKTPINTSFLSLYPKEEVKIFTNTILPELHKKGQWQGELNLQTNTGKRIPSHHNFFLIKDENGQPFRIAAVVTDITKMKAAEMELKSAKEAAEKASKEMAVFKRFADTTIEGLGMADFNTNILYMNKGLHDLHGFDKTHINTSFLKLYPKEDVELITSTILPEVKKTGQWQGELNLLTATGKPIPTLHNFFLIRDENGQPYRYAAVITDITEMKEANERLEEKVKERTYELEKTNKDLEHEIKNRISVENELRKSENKLKLAQEIAHLGHWELDLEQNKLYWSDEVYRIFGLQPQEFKATYEDFLNIVHPYDRDSVNRSYNEHINSKIPYNINHRVKLKDDSIKYVNERCDSEFDENGKVIYSLGTVLDITESVLKEQLIVESEKKFKNIFNSSSDGIIIGDLNHAILEYNQAMVDIIGIDSSDAINKKIYDFILPEEIPKVQNRLKHMLNKENVPALEILIKKANGSSAPIEINSKIIDYKGDKAILTIVRDITERKLTQKKIYNAAINAEEEERGRLARELHDGVSPILSTVKLFTQSLVNTDNKEIIKELSEKIGEATNEAVVSLREISNKLNPHILQNFGLVEALSSFISNINKSKIIEIKLKHNFEKRFDGNIEIAIYRILTELINNTIKYGNASCIGININVNSNINIVYNDNGIGFNVDEVMTNRKGLGLYNIQNRLKFLNGNLNLTSSINKGMIANIKIPFE